jgi:hypothetical protein
VISSINRIILLVLVSLFAFEGCIAFPRVSVLPHEDCRQVAVLDAQTGKPIPSAKVRFMIYILYENQGADVTYFDAGDYHGSAVPAGWSVLDGPSCPKGRILDLPAWPKNGTFRIVQNIYWGWCWGVIPICGQAYVHAALVRAEAPGYRAVQAWAGEQSHPPQFKDVGPGQGGARCERGKLIILLPPSRSASAPASSAPTSSSPGIVK